MEPQIGTHTQPAFYAAVCPGYTLLGLSELPWFHLTFSRFRCQPVQRGLTQLDAEQ